MVWYQLFEYAIGHWLQKATEHMIGCVMCSPGCFSLFRAKALMDDNVMRRYGIDWTLDDGPSVALPLPDGKIIIFCALYPYPFGLLECHCSSNYPMVTCRYTTKSEEPIHYVQYDQGEDRWLCTLLLQRGYRVEYSAASDAYTHCPESFNEFFTQRR